MHFLGVKALSGTLWAPACTGAGCGARYNHHYVAWLKSDYAEFVRRESKHDGNGARSKAGSRQALCYTQYT